MKRTNSISLVFAILFCFSMASSAQNPGEPSLRAFVGLSSDNYIIAGAFDGESFFTTPDNDLVLVPKIKPGIGAGLHLGFSLNRADVDFAYSKTFHEYTYGDTLIGRGVFNYVRFIHVKGYLNENKLRPFWDIDFSGTWSSYEDAAYKYISDNYAEPVYEKKNGIYGGLIIGLGGGISYFFKENISLCLNIIPSWYIGTDVKVKTRNGYEIQKFHNFLLNNSLGLYYYFKKV